MAETVESQSRRIVCIDLRQILEEGEKTFVRVMLSINSLAMALKGHDFSRRAALVLVCVALLSAASTEGQDQSLDWQAQVRQLAEARDWPSAMRIVDDEIARAPQDMDVRAWRARLFAWSGRLREAENEYLEIVKVARTDPDDWMGL